MSAKPLETGYGWRLVNPGRVMDNALRRFEDRVMELMRASGHAEIRRSHVNLTRHLDLEGTRITVLARRAAMTNAAMTELIDHCEKLELVERVPDPVDGRARVVRFTKRGLKWLDAFGRSVEQAQREMLKAIGQRAMDALLSDVATYAAEPGAQDQ